MRWSALVSVATRNSFFLLLVTAIFSTFLLHVFSKKKSPQKQKGSIVMMGRRSEKIARKKGAEDAKRGKVFARIGKKIIMVRLFSGK